MILEATLAQKRSGLKKMNNSQNNRKQRTSFSAEDALNSLLTRQSTWEPTFAALRVLYLNEGLDAGLEDHVGVEQEGAQEGLRVAGQLGYDTREQDVDVERVLEHVLQLGKQNHYEWTWTRREEGIGK